MGTVTVRVIPRASRPHIQVQERRGIIVRVRSAPQGGTATEEARRALAQGLGLEATAVRVRSGARSRTKIFEVEGFDQAAAEMRLRET